MAGSGKIYIPRLVDDDLSASPSLDTLSSTVCMRKAVSRYGWAHAWISPSIDDTTVAIAMCLRDRVVYESSFAVRWLMYDLG